MFGDMPIGDLLFVASGLLFLSLITGVIKGVLSLFGAKGRIAGKLFKFSLVGWLLFSAGGVYLLIMDYWRGF